MNRLLSYVVTIGLVSAAFTARADADSQLPSGIANRSWAITTAVLENHVAPPSRQEMLLGGIEALLKQGQQEIPADLSSRMSNVSRDEQWSGLLTELWPKDSNAPAASLETALLTGVLQPVPGDAHLITAVHRKAMEEFAGNRYVGTGVQIGYSPEENLAHLVSLFRNGPAHQAGARPGDLILEIDGNDARDVGLQRVVDWLRGDEGTDVTVVVRQPDSDEKRTLTITRGVSPIETVLGYERVDDKRWSFRPVSDAKVGYVAITSFNSSTLHELKAMEAQLRSGSVDAVVLDLRFAQGGSAHNAGLVADGLLDGGTMWRLRDARQNVRECKADRDCVFRGLPLVVLVDQLTSAPAAWVAGALQDNGRATLVGQSIVREGFSKSFVDVPGTQHALEIATGLVEQAKSTKAPESEDEVGRPRAWTIRPDHAVSTTQQEQMALHQWVNDKLRPEPSSSASLAPKDAQLQEAIEVLRHKWDDGRP
jgi:carboxyl-terminal processing protease